MSTSRQMLIILVAFLSITTAAIAKQDDNTAGRAKLWLSATDSTYVGADSDAWLADSEVVANSSFDLNVFNSTKDSPIYLTRVVLSIPHDTADSGWSFKLGGTDFDYSSFSNTGTHTYLSNHGIFANSNGALWAELEIGTINAEETKTLAYAGTGMPDNMYIHFDAYGSSEAGAQNGWYNNPYSHDVTGIMPENPGVVTPEPLSMVLFGLGGIPLAARYLRKRS